MKNPPNSSEQALEDYFNDLLGEPAPLKGVVDAAVLKSAAESVPLKSAELATLPDGLPQLRPAAKLAQLPTRATAAMAAPATALRAYAEPVRTFNLRMPLPQLAPQTAPAQPQPAAKPVLQPAPLAKLAPAARPVGPDDPSATPPAPIARRPEPAPEPEPAVVPAEPASPVVERDGPGAPPAWHDNGRPAWAQQPFECLLFDVGGLGLAAPLAELGSIYILEPAALTTMFGQAPWFMGLLPVKGGGNVRVIDAAQVVMPERYTADMRPRYRYAISLHGSDWALAVDGVADSIVLQPDDVRWRSQRSKRPWLAGTVVERMCALLDVAQLVSMFENQDGKRGGAGGVPPVIYS